MLPVFPKTVNINAKTLTVEYKPTSKYLIAPSAATEFNRAALIAQHYNAAIITGIHYKSGEFVADNVALDLQKFASTATFTNLISISAAEISKPGLLDSLPRNTNIILDLSSAKDTSFVDFSRKFAQKYPQAKLAFKLPLNFDSSLAVALQNLLQAFCRY